MNNISVNNDLDKNLYGKLKWTSIKDTLLKELVKTHRDHKLNIVASQMERRTQRECREKWLNYLSPILKNVPVKSHEIFKNKTQSNRKTGSTKSTKLVMASNPLFASLSFNIHDAKNSQFPLNSKNIIDSNTLSTKNFISMLIKEDSTSISLNDGNEIFENYFSIINN